MPKRTDIQSILVLGSGPIVIGQACEFDYSGTQACRVLRREGYRVVLVNSNPATIMTDPEFADATYIEPLTPEVVERILEKERPDAILPTVGGQTGINLAIALHERGRARAVRRRAARRRRRGAPGRRGPRAVQAGDGGDRTARLPERLRRLARGGAGGRRTTSASRSSCARASRSAARGAAPAYNRDELDEIGASALAASPVAQGADRGVGHRLEGVRARGHPRPAPTTPSWSARSRTSTPWASTPATRSPWRRSRRSPTASTRRCATTPSRSSGGWASPPAAPTSSSRSTRRPARAS